MRNVKRMNARAARTIDYDDDGLISLYSTFVRINIESSSAERPCQWNRFLEFKSPPGAYWYLFNLSPEKRVDNIIVVVFAVDETTAAKTDFACAREQTIITEPTTTKKLMQFVCVCVDSVRACARVICIFTPRREHSVNTAVADAKHGSRCLR